MRFSANLGFLFTGMPLAEAIRRAKAAGFDAVECHWPYDEDRDAVQAALRETGLPMLGLNTRKGPGPQDFGLSALPGREDEARAAIDEAFDYGAAIGAGAVHVMAGRTSDPMAEKVFDANLAYACDRAREAGMTVLIEPLNPRDAPGYFLIGLEKAAATIERLGRPELKIMFDCYHLQITGGDLIERFAAHRGTIGHVQFAAVPSRAEPDEGEVAYDRLLPALEAIGYDAPFGAEYKPRGATEAGLDWMAHFREDKTSRGAV
ncbi:hydroxypyruvate isomerase family protein [Aurantimonas sp. VKM B-3413]|uniref:hydroxypyruvate isomerase family protein n=1 Tax=Aurantimonas sp. VKM B-3413 TaxID=2779401 RepID=UPI001E423BC6|nr:TIM barrel protein [Aurantimonas sp. VKM B-3413]MCB8836906.1 TIM barrel protein [Aurantimonas sp. VKM B-3413]